MTATPHIDPQQASAVGGRTLEVFTGTPRLNAWLFSKLAPHISGDVLEIGSGIGNLSRFIVERARSVVLSDMEAHYLDALSKTFSGDPRVSVATYDLDGEPSSVIASRRFDAIVAVNVIEHIRDDHALVRRLAALLKPGGKLVIYVPACPFAYGSLDRALGHYRRYTPQSLRTLLSPDATGNELLLIIGQQGPFHDHRSGRAGREFCRVHAPGRLSRATGHQPHLDRAAAYRRAAGRSCRNTWKT